MVSELSITNHNNEVLKIAFLPRLSGLPNDCAAPRSTADKPSCQVAILPLTSLCCNPVGPAKTFYRTSTSRMQTLFTARSGPERTATTHCEYSWRSVRPTQMLNHRTETRQRKKEEAARSDVAGPIRPIPFRYCTNRHAVRSSAAEGPIKRGGLQFQRSSPDCSPDFWFTHVPTAEYRTPLGINPRPGNY